MPSARQRANCFQASAGGVAGAIGTLPRWVRRDPRRPSHRLMQSHQLGDQGGFGKCRRHSHPCPHPRRFCAARCLTADICGPLGCVCGRTEVPGMQGSLNSPWGGVAPRVWPTGSPGCWQDGAGWLPGLCAAGGPWADDTRSADPLPFPAFLRHPPRFLGSPPKSVSCLLVLLRSLPGVPELRSAPSPSGAGGA